ncbi:stage VI sporulation protein F [Brevibacillus fortis]|uniref:stage VI sporulation protein F n=1 Tax=Brevibacillus fortis TaxID=2126352 RepID=UPI0038FCBE83
MAKAKGKASAKVKLKAKGNPRDLLKSINKKSKKKWTMGDVRSLAKDFSMKDLKDDKKLSELIKKVSKAVGVKLSDQQMSSVKKQVHDRLG